MQGDPDVLRLLNEQLTSELTAINQYFLHSKMQDNWGFTELAAHTRAESFDEMRHAEEITDRILLLDGLPNYQRIGSLRIGQTLREQFEADLAIEYDVLNRLKPGIVMCLNRPGMSGDSSSWKGWGHVRWFIEEVPAGAA